MHYARLFNVVALSFSLVFSGTYGLVVNAQVLVDPLAPKEQRPTILMAPNGTPLVNIQTPSAAGVSRNTYSQFDVNSNGVILNNSRTHIQSQLGGWVEANPWLNKGEARVILNEINSSNPSYLNGFIEVAGRKAEVIMANPAGISVNGGGFINASHVTLTTGRYGFQNGNANNLQINDGKILIQGAGLNTQDADFTRILAKAVEVNAGIWANNLTVGIGEAEYSFESGDVVQKAGILAASSSDNRTDQFLLDVAHLGGMYAGKITLVGTQAGVGVNNHGYLGATAGNITLSVDGKLQNTGQLYANDSVIVNAGGDINNSGQGVISAQEHIKIQTNASVYGDKESAYLAGFNMSGELSPQSGSIEITAQGNIESQGVHFAGNEIAMQGSGINLSDSQSGSQSIVLNAQSEDLILSSSHLDARELSVSTPGTLHADRAVILTDDIEIRAASLNNQYGYIEQKGDSDINLVLDQGFNNERGSIVSAGKLIFDASFVNNNQGQISSSDVNVAANHLDNIEGILLAKNGMVNIATQGLLNNSGDIRARENVHIEAGNLANEGVIYAVQGSVDIQANKAVNNTGDIAAGQSISAQSELVELGQTSRLTSGLMRESALGASDIRLQADNIKARGELIAFDGLTFQAKEIQLYSNVKLYANQITLKAMNDLYIHGEIGQQALVSAAQRLNAEGKTIYNAGVLLAGEQIDLTTEDAFVNHAEVQSLGHLKLRTGGISNEDNATLLAQEELSLISSDELINYGNLISYGDLKIESKNFSNTLSAVINSQGSLNVKIDEILDNAGNIYTQSDAEINANSVVHGQGANLIGRDLIIRSAAGFNNSGIIFADNSLDLMSGNLINSTSGEIFSGGLTMLDVKQDLQNRGLLDGAINHIVANALYNIGSGRIYGNQIAIQADILENRKEGSQAASIAARQDLNIGVKTLSNIDAQIFSDRDFNVGRVLDDNRVASGYAENLNNIAGSIESSGSMRLMIRDLLNQSRVHKETQTDTEYLVLIQPAGMDRKIPVEDLIKKGWSRTYKYWYVGSGDDIGDGVLGETPIANSNYSTCSYSFSDDDHGDCPVGYIVDPQPIYQVDNPVWAYFNLPRPDAKPSAPVLILPTAPSSEQAQSCVDSSTSEACKAYQQALARYEEDLETDREKIIAYDAALIAWQQVTEARYDALDLKINAYNNSFPNQGFGSFTEYKLTRTTSSEKVTSQELGKILSGGDMYISGGGSLINDQGHIIAGGTLTGSVERIENKDTKGEITTRDVGTSQYSWGEWHGGFRRYHHRHYNGVVGYDSGVLKTTENLGIVRRESHAAPSLSNMGQPELGNKSSQAISVPARSLIEIIPNAGNLANNWVIRTLTPEVNLPSASMYQQHIDPGAQYLVETDPRFASYKDWLNSDYILEQLKFDGDEAQKRLGDGFYEQRLIRDQINQLTGQNFLGDYRNEEEQYLALMTAGVNFAQEHQLVPGVALSAEQMAALTTDIVWLTSADVILPDGSVQKVLVPQLYALMDSQSVAGQSGIISARQMELNARSELHNTGTLLAQQGLSAHATNITNQGGRIQAAELRLTADNNITNMGGELRAQDSLELLAKGDIVIETTISQSSHNEGGSSYIRTVIDRVAGVFIGENATGNIFIDAGNALKIIGGEIVNASESVLQLIAGKDVKIESLALQQKEYIVSDKNNYNKYDSLKNHGSTVDSQGGLILKAGNNVELNSAQINSSENIDIYAQNILIAAQVDSTVLNQKRVSKTTSERTTTQDGFVQQVASDSTLVAKNINLNGTDTIAITGSQLNATNDLSIGEVKMVQQADGNFKAVNGEGSPNNLVVNTLELANETWHERSVEKRGMAKTLTQVAAVTGALMLPSLAPGLDMPEMSLGESSAQRTISTTHQGSELSAGNNMVLAAKDSVHVTSGEINAGGTAVVLSDNVTFDAAVDTHITETSHKESTIKGLGASLGRDQVTLGGMEKTKQTDTERTTTTTHQGTQINVGNLVVMADNDINFIASDVNVEKDAVVQAGNDLTIEGRTNSTTTETYSKTDTTTVTAGVKNAYVDTALAADAVVKAGEDVKRAEQALRDAEQRVKDGTLAASAIDDYKINLAAATTQLTQASLNLAASGATAVASTATAGFYATGQAETTSTEQRSTTTEQQYQGSNFNVGGNASFNAGNLLNIVGSGIAVDGGLSLNAEHINISAGVEQHSHHSSSQTKTAGVTASTGAGGSVGANASQSQHEADSYSKTHVNSQISAGSFSSDSKTFTLQGANVEIVGDVQLNTEQLTIASVQDTHHSSSKGSSYSVGVSVSGSGGDLSGASGSAGFGKNSSSEDSQWVNNQTTLIGGGEMNITADKTTVTGGMIANATRNNDGSLTDHGNMNLVTDELIINDLQDHNKSSSQGFNANVSAGWSEGSGNQKGHLTGTSTVGVQKGGHNTEQTTYATLGGGTVQKKDGTAHDIADVNNDLSNTQEITLDQQTGGLDATVTVDHRLTSEQGRAQIQEDVTKSGMIVDTVALIATTDRVGITDFFKETGKSHTTYEAIKSEIANNPELAAQLTRDDLAPAEKEAMLNQLTHSVMVELGYSTGDYQNVLVANEQDHVVKDGVTYERHGFYSEETQNAYINDAFISDTDGLVTTAGHEMSHAMDDRDGSETKYSEQDNDTYATQFGNNFGDYTNVAMSVTGNGSMADKNQHVGNNSEKVRGQTESYNQLDKSKGDDFLQFIPPLIAAGAMIASDIPSANGPSPDDNLDEIPQSRSLLPIDVLGEGAKELTDHQYDTAIDFGMMVGNPSKLIKDGADILGSVAGKAGKTDGSDVQEVTQAFGEKLDSGSLPSGYTRNADGTVTGPRDGVATPTGQYDIETKNEIMQRKNPDGSDGGYYTNKEDGTQQSVNSPYPNDGSTIQANREQGKKFEQESVARLKQEKNVVAEQVTVETVSGNRTVLDIVSKDKQGNFGCHECKSSTAAPLTENQKVAFPEIESTGAVVVGSGKPGVEGGTIIPPTKVEIIRPE